MKQTCCLMTRQRHGCVYVPGAAELRADLERVTGLSLPPTLAFDYPTPAEAATMLAGRMAAAAHATGSAPDAHAPSVSPSQHAAPGGSASGTGRASSRPHAFCVLLYLLEPTRKCGADGHNPCRCSGQALSRSHSCGASGVCWETAILQPASTSTYKARILYAALAEALAAHAKPAAAGVPPFQRPGILTSLPPSF